MKFKKEKEEMMALATTSQALILGSTLPLLSRRVYSFPMETEEDQKKKKKKEKEEKIKKE